MGHEIAVTVVRCRPACQQTRSWPWTAARAFCVGGEPCALLGTWPGWSDGCPRTRPATSTSTRAASTARPAASWRRRSSASRERDLAYVHRQPQTEAEERRALMALVACPTASIGTSAPDGRLRGAPPPSRNRIGGRRLLLRLRRRSRPTAPRATWSSGRRATCSWTRRGRRRRCCGASTALGGVRWMFLTHRDDVADHARFRAHFGCERVLHAADVTADTARRRAPHRGRRAGGASATTCW